MPVLPDIPVCLWLITRILKAIQRTGRNACPTRHSCLSLVDNQNLEGDPADRQECLSYRAKNMSTNERDLIVGGQAVIEGVMMRTPNAYAIAVRKADGTIVNIAARMPKWSDKYPLLKLPVLRGSAVLVQSMGLGIKALNYSANEAFGDAQEAEAKAESKQIRVALTPAAIEGEGDFAGLT